MIVSPSPEDRPSPGGPPDENALRLGTLKSFDGQFVSSGPQPGIL
jgi:hypothetical protein